MHLDLKVVEVRACCLGGTAAKQRLHLDRAETLGVVNGHSSAMVLNCTSGSLHAVELRWSMWVEVGRQYSKLHRRVNKPQTATGMSGNNCNDMDTTALPRCMCLWR